jgi:hypothetical protein
MLRAYAPEIANARSRNSSDAEAAAAQALGKAQTQQHAAYARLAKAEELIAAAQRDVRLAEAKVMGAESDFEYKEYYSKDAQQEIAGFESPCREAQMQFFQSQSDYHEYIRKLRDRKDSITSRVPDQSAANARELATVSDQLDNLKEPLQKAKLILDNANAELDRSSQRLQSLRSGLQTVEATIQTLRRTVSGTRTQSQAQLAAANQRRTQILADIKTETANNAAAAAIQNAAAAYQDLQGLQDNLQRKKANLEQEKQRLAGELEQAQLTQHEIEVRKHDFETKQKEFHDRMQYLQSRIYAKYGGPRGIHGAFYMNVEQSQGSKLADGGMVRTIDILPRQTALNVNQTNVSERTSAISFAFKWIFAFGGKMDYERMREHYDQFVQQEVFASGFGKGDTTFGWTFGPVPGSRVLNAGTRTTYAALTVPNHATGLEMQMLGCSFHHNAPPPSRFPSWNEEEREGVDCGTRTLVTLGLPDRDSSGSFWVNQVRYSRVKPGERATVVLQGMFSPETNVLVNGKRLTQVIGLGKPLLAMDAGGAEDPGSGVIAGSYEYVNEHYMTLLLNVPADFKSSAFPEITLISPSRSSTINSLPLVINDEYGKRLDEEKLLVEGQTAMKLTGVQFLGVDPDDPAKAIVRLTGERLSHVAKLWINGTTIMEEYRTPLSDTAILAKFRDPGTLRWNFTAVTGEDQTASRTVSPVSVDNPMRLMISAANVKSVEYDSKSKPKTAVVVLTGNNFTPDLVMTAENAGVQVAKTFISAEEYSCVVTLGGQTSNIVFDLDDGRLHRVASPPVNIPPKPEPPKAAPDGTTTTETDTKQIVTKTKSTDAGTSAATQSTQSGKAKN